jgi:hypothetical protein
MTRVYSRNPEPNRILFDRDSDPQRGEDIKNLRSAVQRRLDARGIDRKVGPDDGRLTPDLYDALKTASHFLGAPDEWYKSKSGLLTREQLIIRYPGTRTEDMLKSADDRMHRLVLDREKAEKARKAKLAAQAANAGAHGTSNLTAAQRIKARELAVNAFRLAYNHRGVVHYTQSSLRWQGINNRLRAAEGRYPNYADCSSLYTWAMWNALTAVAGMGYPDIVNGSRWAAGYTGTIASHGRWVSPGELMPGDAVLYGGNFPYGHVTMYAGGGMCFSHGSEIGPTFVPVGYRPISTCRRFI